MKKEDIIFMNEALKEAEKALGKDEVPIGAVVVFERKVIAKGYNQVELLKDPTAHAEMIAITSATNHLRLKWLYNCTLYVTVEPCCMCAGALVLARIKRIVFGAPDSKGGAFGSRVDINSLRLNHRLKFTGGVLRQECVQLLQRFFKEKREIKKVLGV